MSTVRITGQPRGQSTFTLTGALTGTSQSATRTSTDVTLSPTWMTVVGTVRELTLFTSVVRTWYIPYLHTTAKRRHKDMATTL